jgi:hypothetical protein
VNRFFHGAKVLLQSPYKARQRRNARFLRALHQPAQRNEFAHTQEGAKLQKPISASSRSRDTAV